MPTVSYGLQGRVARFEKQRWLLDATIQLICPNWDQGRLYYYSAPCAADYQAGIMGLQNTVKKWMVWGLSFGSFRATQAAAAEPRFAACAVMYTCFQPGNTPLYEMACPSFKQRFTYMTGVGDEAEFDAFAPEMDVLKISGKIDMPYLVTAGEDDQLSDIAATVRHLDRVPGPKEPIMYTGANHGLVANTSGELGPPPVPLHRRLARRAGSGRRGERAVGGEPDLRLRRAAGRRAASRRPCLKPATRPACVGGRRDLPSAT